MDLIRQPVDTLNLPKQKAHQLHYAKKHLPKVPLKWWHNDYQIIPHFKNFGTMWFNKNSLSNILPMESVSKFFRITMDTSVEPSITMHRKDGTMMRFKEFHFSLYYYNTGPE